MSLSIPVGYVVISVSVDMDVCKMNNVCRHFFYISSCTGEHIPEYREGNSLHASLMVRR